MSSLLLSGVRRIASAFLVLWLTITLAFVAQRLLPSDPARAMAGPQARAQDVAAIRAQLHLDRPVSEQYVTYLSELAHGNLGTSYQRRRPVSSILGRRLPATLLLGSTALLLQLLIGLIAGTIAAARKGTTVDRLTIALTLLGVSAPTFVTGLLLQYWLGFRLRWFPLDSMGDTPWETARSLVLPALTLGLFGGAFYARIVRDEMGRILAAPFLRTAKAKGLSTTRRILVHGLRNAAMPLLTVLGMDLGTMIGGAVVTEEVFRWPGLGRLSVQAVLSHDTPVIMALVLLSAVAVLSSSMLVDLLYLVLDPRLRRKTPAVSGR